MGTMIGKSGWVLSLLIISVSSLWATTSQEYFQAGVQTYKQAQYDRAILYLQAAVQQDPQNWQAYQVLGQSYYQAGKRPEAVQAMRESLRLNPNNPGLENFVKGLEPADSAAEAPKPPAGGKTHKGLYFNLGGGGDLPTGGGQVMAIFQMNGGYTLDKNLSLQLECDLMSAQEQGYVLENIRLVPEIKYVLLNSNSFEPYGLVGLGLDTETIPQHYFGGISQPKDLNFFGPAFMAGAGIEMGVPDLFTFYIEAKLSIVSLSDSSGMGTDIPLTAGFRIDL